MSDVDVQRIVAYLQSEWSMGLRPTTVAQAMAALSLPPDDEVRWQVGRALEVEWRQRHSGAGFFRGVIRLISQDFSQFLRFLPGVLFTLPGQLREARDWNPAIYILTADEKLIARYILLAHKQARPVPSAMAIATSLSIPHDPVARGLAMLARLGFLSRTNGDYTLAPDHERFTRGLGFNFHTITLSNGEVFNVP
ncbi:MAG: hypothetical protein L0287_04595 [Anaerolineae bacterium]|nr:hypothetical protein [Anaerolineae bacterium]MCI0610170.1 hypothetical protein [Anaerolineae bacterium]